LRVVSEDVDAYQRLIDRLLKLELGIAQYFTYVVTKTVKATDPTHHLAV
jgi:Lrp/AsnC family transcriptional regulator of ectoine degradation